MFLKEIGEKIKSIFSGDPIESADTGEVESPETDDSEGEADKTTVATPVTPNEPLKANVANSGALALTAVSLGFKIENLLNIGKALESLGKAALLDNPLGLPVLAMTTLTSGWPSKEQQVEQERRLQENSGGAASTPPDPNDPNDPKKAPNYKDKKATAEEFGYKNTKEFERGTKQDILHDARAEAKDGNTELSRFLRNNDNPDILTDDTGSIWLKSRNPRGGCIDTGLPKSGYFRQ